MAEKRLKIVVPYRDRREHLDHFLPHIQGYMDDEDIAYHIVIAEQEDGLPFNRGAMKNAGFLLGGASDYTCFHDVDYLPLNADYSWTEDPTCLVLVGAEGIAIKVGEPSHRAPIDMTKFFGGAVMMPDALFRQVNGYSNDYWGWGYEDTDMVRRLAAAGLSCLRRPGTFYPLAHNSHGYEADGGLNEEAALNRVVFLRKGQGGAAADGLSTLSYELLARETLAQGDGGNGLCERIMVRLFRPGDTG